jgi:hypothetical protein
MTDNQEAATTEAILAITAIARKYHVCPACLTFNVASIIEDELDAGTIEHIGGDDDHETIQ